LVDAAGLTWEAMRALGGAAQILEVIDRLLFLLMLIEILHTVRVSMRSGTLTCEPFLIVGLIASIRRVLVITLQSSEITHAKDWSPEKQALFQASMIELGVLAGLIVTMVFAIFLLHRARDDGRPAGEEKKSGVQAALRAICTRKAASASHQPSRLGPERGIAPSSRQSAIAIIV